MMLSTKGRYGIRAMYELALGYGKGPLSVKEIAARQEIPEKYLEQLIAPLRREGLVRSIRGTQGGYELAAAPTDISVLNVLTALEGPMAPVNCVVDDDFCQNTERCAMFGLWQRIQLGMEELLGSISMADILSDASALPQASLLKDQR